jgi:hypothetical protein
MIKVTITTFGDEPAMGLMPEVICEEPTAAEMSMLKDLLSEAGVRDILRKVEEKSGRPFPDLASERTK